jgi:hypothetical protein
MPAINGLLKSYPSHILARELTSNTRAVLIFSMVTIVIIIITLLLHCKYRVMHLEIRNST